MYVLLLNHVESFIIQLLQRNRELDSKRYDLGGSATSLAINPDVREIFPDLYVLVNIIIDVTVKKTNPELESFKEAVITETRKTYDLRSVKDEPVFRAYRDFFWKVKVDPTKNRPAAEALIRRALSGNPLPQINTLVDSYNLASIKTEIAIAAFDADRISGNLTMRFADRGEEFLGIGMKKPMALQGGEIVIQDEKKLVAIYPYRDAEDSKITDYTRNVILLFCGVPGISLVKLGAALTLASDLVRKFCGGAAKP